MNVRGAVVPLHMLAEWRAQERAASRRVVVTNGCFDLLHPGHVSYLEQARAQGDVLLVGLNSDASVQAIKGHGRPVNTESDRAVVLSALRAVDAVCVFPEPTATHFLTLAQPDVYVKGGDYTLDTLNQEERRVVENSGGRIVMLPFLPGKSTTALLRKIGQL